MAGSLYLVATPIGNLKDISFRAVEILSSVGLIACEDTRHSLKLLNHYGIKQRLVSYHEHNERERTPEIIAKLSDGLDVALISDAGTPAINDPGYVLVKAAIDAGINVISIPGPVAYVNAVIISGLSTDFIYFGGFLPSKKGDRRKVLADAADIPATLAFYESPHRLARSLQDCFEVLGDRQAVLVREITKLHEQAIRSGLKELADQVSDANMKGEFVLVIDRARAKTHSADDNSSLGVRVRELEAAGSDHRSALKTAAKEFGLTRSEAYRRLHGSDR